MCVYIFLNACYLITLLPYYYWWYSIDVCAYLFKCLLPYYLITIGDIIWLRENISKGLLPYYLITIGDIIWLCENISKCLLPYYCITLLLLVV